MNFTKLEEFAANKKKSDISAAKKQEFENEFTSLLTEEGFSKNSEKYYFLCYSISGAQCLYGYLASLSSDQDRSDFLIEILTSERYKKNEKYISYRVGLGIFAVVINKHLSQQQVFAHVIRDIPAYAGKNGKYCNEKDTQFSKLLLNAISEKAVLPPFTDINIKPGIIKQFTSFCKDCVEYAKSNRTAKENAIVKFEQWLSSGNPQLTAPDVPAKQIGAAVLPEKREILIHSHAASEPQTVSKPENEAETTIGKSLPPAKASDSIRQIVLMLDAAAGQVDKSERESAVLTERLEEAKRRFASMTCEIDQLKQQLRVKDEMLSDLSEQLKSTNANLSEEQNRCRGLETQIDTMKSVVTVYSSAGDNQVRETLNSLADKLVVDYLEYIDSTKMEMTLDLGDNLRYQLESVFKKLKKAGVDVEGMSNGH